MKNLQILMMCCFLVLLTACGREGGTAQTPVASEEITESITQMPDEQESEAMPENMELGLTVNGVYYPIPISLKQLTDDGWKISGRRPISWSRSWVKSITKRGQIGPYPKMAGDSAGWVHHPAPGKRRGVVRGDHYKPGVHRVGYAISKNRRWCGRFHGGFL